MGPSMSWRRDADMRKGPAGALRGAGKSGLQWFSVWTRRRPVNVWGGQVDGVTKEDVMI